MGWLTDGSRCPTGAAKYAAYGSALGPKGALVGGVYGCLFKPGKSPLDELREKTSELRSWWRTKERQGRNLWRQSRNLVRDVAGWFGFGKRPEKKVTKPTLEQAVGLMLHHLTSRHGKRSDGSYGFELQGTNQRWYEIHAAHILSPSNLTALYGPGAAQWEPSQVYSHFAAMWNKTDPDWDESTRWAMSFKRVGDFARLATARQSIDSWPLYTQEESAAAIKNMLIKPLSEEHDRDGVYSKTTSEVIGSHGGRVGLALGLLGTAITLTGMALDAAYPKVLKDEDERDEWMEALNG